MYQKHFSTKNVWVQNKFLSRIGLISIVLKPIKFVVVFVVIVFVVFVKKIGTTILGRKFWMKKND